jgi:hypothetical protein
VSARLVRQQRLTERPLLELWAVIGEGALHRQVGGPKVMADQLGHLLNVVELPNVKVQVLPFGAGAHGAMSGPLTLLDFADPADPSVAYLEYPVGAHLVDDPDMIATLAMLFDDLRDQALSTRESAELIAHLRQQKEAEDG